MWAYPTPAAGAQLRSEAVSSPGAAVGIEPWEGQRRPEMIGPSPLFSSLPLPFCEAEPESLIRLQSKGNQKNCLGKNSYLFKVEKKDNSEETETCFQYMDLITWL